MYTGVYRLLFQGIQKTVYQLHFLYFSFRLPCISSKIDSMTVFGFQSNPNARKESRRLKASVTYKKKYNKD
uniref:Putative ovule protein n=1 Tax=Solanum chacoense TaxID=4108 RepID=A0A0V0HQM8_SOLCH